MKLILSNFRTCDYQLQDSLPFENGKGNKTSVKDGKYCKLKSPNTNDNNADPACVHAK